MKNNSKSIIIAAAILAAFLIIVIRGIRNKKRGRCSCGCGGCAMSDTCNKSK